MDYTLLVSGIVNGVLLFYAFSLKKKINKLLEEPKKELTVDARELLNDLTAGSALVQVTRISPVDLFIRR